MRKKTAVFALLFSCQFTPSLLAQSVDPADVDALLNFAEQAEPTLFSPPGQLTLDTVTDWLYRFYPGSQSYAAVHTGSSGEFVQSGVYTLGGPFGDDVVFIDTLANLITLIDNNNPPPNGESGITNNGNGNCVDINPPAAGTIANYQQTSGNGGLLATTDFSDEYIQVSETMFEVESTSSSNFGGLMSTTISRTVNSLQIVDDLRFTISIDSQVTSSTPGFGDTNQRVLVTYDPNLFQGPAQRMCEDQEWSSASVEQTVSVFADGASEPSSVNISDSPPSTTVVETVNDAISVPAGNFSAVRTRSTFPGITNVIWTDPTTGLLLRNENIDRDDGTITILTELQSIE